MNTHYTDEKNILILLSLLKKYGIKKVVASPGTTNMTLIASMQQDPYFEMYSSVDERSAAYIACGLSEESNEPVVISCTGATASRNYMSGLTEAFYRKLPILAITSTKDIAKIGQHAPQLIDRRVLPNDIAKLSIQVPVFRTKEDEKNYTVLLNEALLELKHNGGGPVHINLTTNYSHNYNIQSLPKVNSIRRFEYDDTLPTLPEGNIGIFVSQHSKWSLKLTAAVEKFCECFNAVVLCDHISNYTGKYGVHFNLVTYQKEYFSSCCNLDLMIYIGEIYGIDYQKLCPKKVWRVNRDGKVRDTFGNLQYVFQMSESDFFERYCSMAEGERKNIYYKAWAAECSRMKEMIPELPFSNIWVAQQLAPMLPQGCSVHFGIQNSLRSWNFFDLDSSIRAYCNTGGFGIDGTLSSFVGASFANTEKLFFCIIGDLSFFYDMNVLGNRHIKNNLRVILINNGRGQQFRNPGSSGSLFGDDADAYIAAGGHFGNMSPDIVKHFAQDLGFEYITASGKEEFHSAVLKLLEKNAKSSIVFEVFTDTKQEGEAYERMRNIMKDPAYSRKVKCRNAVDTVINSIGKERIHAVKKLIKG